MRLRSIGVVAALLAGAVSAMPSAAVPAPPDPPRTVRMYVFDCGVLRIADPMPLFGLEKGEVGATDLKEVAPAQGDQEISLKSRAAVDAFLKKTGGQMWITHDLIGFSKLKKSPQYYE